MYWQLSIRSRLRYEPDGILLLWDTCWHQHWILRLLYTHLRLWQYLSVLNRLPNDVLLLLLLLLWYQHLLLNHLSHI